jgi:transcriptional regulator GlxA family with amidase domain
MLNVAVLLYDNAELLDFTGPYEVFTVASQLNETPLMNVFSVSHDGKTVSAANGMKVVPDYAFANCPTIDILAIPGGIGARVECENPVTLDFVSHIYQQASIVFTVCSGTRIVAKLGLLDGQTCTSHHSVFANLKEIAPNIIIDEESRFVDNGKIMTAGGISAGIDLALHIVSKLFGSRALQKTVEYMEYGDWKQIRAKRA